MELEQIEAVPKPDGAVLYARRSDGAVFKYIDKFGERRGEWIRMPRVPGVGILGDMEC
jgi:hypothetical protein